MRVETVYTEEEWMKHVERHARKILRRYIIRKAHELIGAFVIIGLFTILLMVSCLLTRFL